MDLLLLLPVREVEGLLKRPNEELEEEQVVRQLATAALSRPPSRTDREEDDWRGMLGTALPYQESVPLDVTERQEAGQRRLLERLDRELFSNSGVGTD